MRKENSSTEKTLNTVSVDSEVKYEAIKGVVVNKYIQMRVETTMSEVKKRIVFNLTEVNLKELLKELKQFKG